jgi:hypothetical protein
VLGPNNYFTEKSSYAKLREVTLSYNVGRIVNAVRDLQIGVTGRKPVHLDEVPRLRPRGGHTSGSSRAASARAR